MFVDGVWMKDDQPVVRWLEKPGELGEVSAEVGVSVGLLTLLVIGGVVYYLFLR
jgi:hypothetical protein